MRHRLFKPLKVLQRQPQVMLGRGIFRVNFNRAAQVRYRRFVLPLLNQRGPQQEQGIRMVSLTRQRFLEHLRRRFELTPLVQRCPMMQ